MSVDKGFIAPEELAGTGKAPEGSSSVVRETPPHDDSRRKATSDKERRKETEAALDRYERTLLMVPKYMEHFAKLNCDGSNFRHWSLSVEMAGRDLIRRRISLTISLNPHEDSLLSRILLFSVVDDLRYVIAEAGSGMAAYERLTSMFNRSTRANHAYIWKEVTALRFDGDDAMALQKHATTVRNAFKTLVHSGFEFNEETISGLVLQMSLPVETLGPFNTLAMTLDSYPQPSFDDVLQLATAQLTNHNLRQGARDASVSANRVRVPDHPRLTHQTSSAVPERTIWCFWCLQQGHTQTDCPKRKAGESRIVPPESFFRCFEHTPKDVSSNSRHLTIGARPTRVNARAAVVEANEPADKLGSSTLFWEDAAILDSGADHHASSATYTSASDLKES